MKLGSFWYKVSYTALQLCVAHYLVLLLLLLSLYRQSAHLQDVPTIYTIIITLTKATKCAIQNHHAPSRLRLQMLNTALNASKHPAICTSNIVDRGITLS